MPVEYEQNGIEINSQEMEESQVNHESDLDKSIRVNMLRLSRGTFLERGLVISQSH